MEYWIPACSGKRIEVRNGQKITVVDVDGGQVVDFFAEVTGEAREFLSTGVTIDCNESLRLSVGDTIYTNLYRPILKVLQDDVGEHDLLYFSLRNLVFTTSMEDDTKDDFHVLALVDGEKVRVESVEDPSRYFDLNMLDIVVVPATFGKYRVVNKGIGVAVIHKTMLKP